MNNVANEKDIVDKLLDLQKQATTEKSHYYVAACITKAIQEIMELRNKVASQPIIEPDADKEARYEYCTKCGRLKVEYVKCVCDRTG